MSEPADSDDFLGWAPDLGPWDASAAPPMIATPPQLRAVVAPPPMPYQAPGRRSGLVAHPPTPTRPLARPNRWAASKLRVPVLVSFAVMVAMTLWTALRMAVEGPQSSPLMLGVFGAVTALLGRVIWTRMGR
ncbi:MAG: hypothetical protein ACOH1Y_14390 [Propionicimonas sp.]